jgi:hypothetical protein
MTIYDIDLVRTADLWRRRHGDTAVAEAKKMAAQYQAAGDQNGADIWRHVSDVVAAKVDRSSSPIGSKGAANSTFGFGPRQAGRRQPR